MTQLFDSYTSDIKTSFETIRSGLSTCSQSSLSNKQSNLPSLRVQLYEIQKLIKLMETEIVSFKGKEKNFSAQKIKTYKMEYQTARKKVSAVEQDVRKERNKVKGQTTPNTTSNSLELGERSGKKQKSNKYQKLQQTRSDDQDINSRLKQSVRVMYEISDMSDNVSHQLSNQTSKLQTNTSRLGKIRGQLVKGEKKIKRIMIRLRRNQFVFYMVMLMIMLMAAFVLVKAFR